MNRARPDEHAWRIDRVVRRRLDTLEASSLLLRQREAALGLWLVRCEGPACPCRLMFKRELMLRVLRFGLVGGTVTSFFMALNWLLASRLGSDLAFLAAYPPTVLLHFCLNKWWTFRDQSEVGRRQVSEYLLMTVVAFLIQAGGFKLLTSFTPMPSWLASGVSTVAQMALAFVVMHLRVFAASRG